MARNLTEYSELISKYARETAETNFHAQAHARAIMAELETPKQQWPKFMNDLDERLFYSANFYINSGLELFGGPETQKQAIELLTRGAEGLELIAIDQSELQASRRHELLKAAVAYHIAGHHARAYVLMDDVKKQNSRPSAFCELIAAILERNLNHARDITIRFFRQEKFNDDHIAMLIAEGGLAHDAAINRLGQRSLAQAVSLYLEFAKTGNKDFIARAQVVIGQVKTIALEGRIVDLWWWARALEHLLKEFYDSSLWTNVGHFSPEGVQNGLIRNYIRGHLARHAPITNLWPSQLGAIKWIIRPGKPSFCVRMPTSAGKTKIAELTILKTILDNPKAKCVYIAPFRALAVEIERTLRQGLGPIGIRVSEIYGGFDLSYSELKLIEQTQILVATPEKLDAIMRQAPELLEDLGLLIVDEGHIAGEGSERGLRAEFLLNRFLRRYPRTSCRYVFVSAVLPNPEDFSLWISGNAENRVESDWRPSRLMLGECSWDGSQVDVTYTHDGSKKIEHECFFKGFARKTPCRGLEGVGGRRNPFPNNAREAFALSAIRFSQQGTTLAFIPQARHVESIGESVMEALKIQGAIRASKEKRFEIPSNELYRRLSKKCISVIKEELGEDSILIKFIEAGFVVHHSNLPSRVRSYIEDLIRSNSVRLIISTTTLAAGVNLPIKTVFVRGVQQNQDQTIDPLTFWNICGRAGRAMKENEGQILFFLDETQEQSIRRQRTNARNLIERTQLEAVIGVLNRALVIIGNYWKRAKGRKFEELCLRLAEDDFDWLEDKEERQNLTNILSLIDRHLLALTVEHDNNLETADRLEEILRESLLFAQLKVRKIPDLDEQKATRLLFARLQSINKRVPGIQRRKFYRLGLSLTDCHLIEEMKDQLRALFDQCREWYEWDTQKRLDTLVNLYNAISELEAVHEDVKLPENFQEILLLWLKGKRPLDILSEKNSDYSGGPGELARLLENMCVYRLSWIINSIYLYVTETTAANEESLPAVCSSFSSMFKYGVNDPVAAMFVPYLDQDRDLAAQVAAICPYKIENADRALAWLQNTSVENFCSLGLSRKAAEKVFQQQRPFDSDLDSAPDHGFRKHSIQLTHPLVSPISAGDRLIIVPLREKGDTSFELFTITGERIGGFKRSVPFTDAWKSIHLVEAVVDEVSEEKGVIKIVFSVNLIGKPR